MEWVVYLGKDKGGKRLGSRWVERIASMGKWRDMGIKEHNYDKESY